MKESNVFEITFQAKSINEGFARVCVSAFCVQLNPSIDEINDIKTAVSEAVTNCVVHAYPNCDGLIKLRCEIKGNNVIIEVSDAGVGIKNINKAREPFYTTKPSEERSGMGFTVMEGFMDSLTVENNESGGIKVIMTKSIQACQSLLAGE